MRRRHTEYVLPPRQGNSDSLPERRGSEKQKCRQNASRAGDQHRLAYGNILGEKPCVGGDALPAAARDKEGGEGAFGENTRTAERPHHRRPRAFHVDELAAHRLAPVARVRRRDANRVFQEHCRSLTEMRFQHRCHPLQKAGCCTIERWRASVNWALANSNPFGVNRYVCRGGTPSSVATQRASSNECFSRRMRMG